MKANLCTSVLLIIYDLSENEAPAVKHESVDLTMIIIKLRPQIFVLLSSSLALSLAIRLKHGNIKVYSVYKIEISIPPLIAWG